MDRVKPLKMENPASGGTETDIMPTEVNPAEDYISVKGITLADSANTYIDESTGAIRFGTNGSLRTTIELGGGLLHPGHTAFGSSASVNANVVNYILESASSPSDLTGVLASVSGANGNGAANGVIGGDFTASLSGGSAILSSLKGIAATVNMDSGAGAGALGSAVAGYFSTLFTGSSTTEDAYGVYVSNVLSNTFGSPVVDNLFGVFISAANTGSTVTGYTALYVGDATGIGSTNWAIRSVGGQSYHVGNLRIGSTVAPTVALDITGSSYVSGHIAAGSSGLYSTGAVVSSYETSTSAAGVVSLAGFDSLVTLAPASSSSRSPIGGRFKARTTASTGSVHSIYGSYSEALSDGAGGATTIYGAGIIAQISAGTTANMYGAVINNIYTAGTLTNNIGLRIESVSGATNNWAIQSAGGQSYHVGNLRIGSTSAPTVALDVTGEAKFSTVLGIASGGTGVSTGAWNRVGNSGMVDATSNLLGTTDNIDIRVLANNARKFNISAATTSNIVFYPDGLTTSVNTEHYFLNSSSTITAAGGAGFYIRYKYFTNTISFSGNPIGIYYDNPNILIKQPAGGANRSVTAFASFFSQNQAQCTDANLTISLWREFQAAPQLNAAVTSGTLTATELVGFDSGGTVSSGTVATDWYAFKARGTNSSGTVTRYYGLHVTAPTATTAYAIYTAGTTGSVHGGRMQFGTTTLSTTRVVGATAIGTTDVNFFAKGVASQTGQYLFCETSAGNTKFTVESNGEARLYGVSGYVGLLGYQGTITSYTLTFPAATGSSGQTLITDGSGNLSWSSPSGATVKHTLVAAVNGVGGSATSDGDFGAAGANVGVKMAYAGTVVALSVHVTSSRTAGTCTAKWTKNGVVQSNTVVIDGTNPDHNYTTFTGVAFSAGDRLGIQTVTASFTPTGADAVLAIWVVY